MRSARVTMSNLEVRIGTECGRLVDISRTGALVRTHAALVVGNEYPLLVNNGVHGQVSLTARVVRIERASNTKANDNDTDQQLIGLQFIQLPATANRMLQDLCEPAFR
jgi:c-di-GMP-binding flagellar brake protein YcgR